MNASVNYNDNRQTVEVGSDIACAAASPSGNIVVASTLEKFIVFALDGHAWRQQQVIELQGASQITLIVMIMRRAR